MASSGFKFVSMITVALSMGVSAFANAADMAEVKRIMSDNLYTRLDVSTNASPQDVSSAYRKLSKRYHPDTNPIYKDGALFRKINEAYEVLKDPLKRAQFDEIRSKPQQNQTSSCPPRSHFNENARQRQDQLEAEHELKVLIALKAKYPDLTRYIDGVIKIHVQPRVKHPGFLLIEPIPFLWPSDLDLVVAMIHEGTPSLLKHVALSILKIPGWENLPEILELLIEKDAPDVNSFLSEFFHYKQWITPRGANILFRLIELGHGDGVLTSLFLSGGMGSVLDTNRKERTWVNHKLGLDLILEIMRTADKKTEEHLNRELSEKRSPWTQLLMKQPEVRAAEDVPYASTFYLSPLLSRRTRNPVFCTDALSKTTNPVVRYKQPPSR